MKMKRLVLFDIDETMIFSDGVGRRAMESALSEVLGIAIDSRSTNMSGKTDPQICYELLGSLGYQTAEISAILPGAFELYLRLLEEEIGKSKRFGLHAGVVELIETLARDSSIYLGLLTGNIEKGARMKLAPFSLNGYFPFGAFGCDSANRMDLPSFAHERARKVFLTDFERSEMVIIGDAVNDILCAKGYGVKSIITNTGKTPRWDLEELNPDYLFESLKDTSKIMEAILA